MHKPELLIPAGNLEKLRTAVLYGADADICRRGRLKSEGKFLRNVLWPI